jgi:uncharacterized ferritin-like protein (DUF455 family)
MEIRDFAERVLLSADLNEKLAAPEGPVTDWRPGSSRRVATPARRDELRLDDGRHGTKMPKHTDFSRPASRGVAHHIMANHELQALEVMAWTLLAFPDAPTPFRAELIDVMIDEQRHTRMHLRRLEAHGLRFGEVPVNGHVWSRAKSSESLLDYLACLPLTFEGGNLDHSLQFASLFEQAGDSKSRDVMRAIHDDEIEHVAFGLKWFRELKPRELSDWDAYLAHLRWPLSAYAGKGKIFQREAREKAGMSPDFIDRLFAVRPSPKRSLSAPGLRGDLGKACTRDQGEGIQSDE